MTTRARAAQHSAGDGGREPVRLVLDVESSIAKYVADRLTAELMNGASVEVVLVLPRASLTLDAALVAVRHRRLAQARQHRIEELAQIAGPLIDQVSVSVHRRRWRGAHTPLHPTSVRVPLASLLTEGLPR